MVFTLDRTLGGPVTDAVAGLAADGFYDGLTFHRVVPDFVLQGGDPDGTGAGGPGFSTVKAPPSDYAYKLGDVAMAKTQDEAPGTGGSQFFIISGASGEQLPPDYAVVAHTSDPDSLATIARIGALGVTDGPPSQPVWIEKATVFERSGVIVIEAQITSIFFEVRAGMMPSQAVSTISQSILPALHTALARSTSKPSQTPAALLEAKGG